MYTFVGKWKSRPGSDLGTIFAVGIMLVFAWFVDGVVLGLTHLDLAALPSELWLFGIMKETCNKQK